jgi:hypothetical protein
MSLLALSVVCLGILLGFVSWVVSQLALQNGRILRRLTGLEQPGGEAAPPAPRTRSALVGLPLGSLAPDFALPTVAGDRMTLSRWRGQRVLLIFFDPRCGFCRQMLPALAALSSDPALDRPMPLILAAAMPPRTNRSLNSTISAGPSCSARRQTWLRPITWGRPRRAI